MLSPEDSAWVETPQPLFSPRSAGPTVQRLVLGGHLRRLREEAGMTTEQAAASIRGSHSKISRMEHGRVGFKERDIADLLTLYGVGQGAEREALLNLAREVRLSPGELDHVVELAVLGASQERGDLRARVDKGGSSGEAGIAHRDLAVRQVRYLNARAVGVAVLALLPSDIGEFRGRYAVVWLSHVLFLPATEPGCVTGLKNSRSPEG